jgi:hypothetical protein
MRRSMSSRSGRGARASNIDPKGSGAESGKLKDFTLRQARITSCARTSTGVAITARRRVAVSVTVRFGALRPRPPRDPRLAMRGQDCRADTGEVCPDMRQRRMDRQFRVSRLQQDREMPSIDPDQGSREGFAPFWEYRVNRPNFSTQRNFETGVVW